MKFDIGNWVKSARLNADLSQEELALALNLSGKASVSAWETNKNGVSFDVMVKISNLCGYPLPYIEPDNTKMIRKSKNGYIRINYLNVCNDIEERNVENIEIEPLEAEQIIEIPEAWAKENIGNNLTSIAIIKAKGDSMNPTLKNGDLLFIDTTIQFYMSDGIYVFYVDNGFSIKRLQLLFDGQYRVMNDNQSRYPSETITRGDLDKIHICGKVVAYWTINRL